MLEALWKTQKTVEGKTYWKYGWSEIWLEDGKYNFYSYKPSKGKKMKLIKSFDNLEECKKFGANWGLEGL